MTNNDEILIIPPDKIKLTHIFDSVGVHSDYLQNILKKVCSIISRSVDIKENGFGAVFERSTSSGEAGEVTEDGDINLDSKQLKKYDDEIAMALIAHELAHYHLGHYYDESGELELKNEYEADDLARKWGFNIDKFREVCGDPFIKKI